MSSGTGREVAFRSSRLSMALPWLIVTVLPYVSHAQQEQAAGSTPMEEIIVTAQYREQSVQDVPIAISAFSSEQLAKQSITGLADISRLAPDFTAINDVGFVRLSVRGVQS